MKDETLLLLIGVVLFFGYFKSDEEYPYQPYNPQGGFAPGASGPVTQGPTTLANGQVVPTGTPLRQLATAYLATVTDPRTRVRVEKIIAAQDNPSCAKVNTGLIPRAAGPGEGVPIGFTLNTGGCLNETRGRWQDKDPNGYNTTATVFAAVGAGLNAAK